MAGHQPFPTVALLESLMADDQSTGLEPLGERVKRLRTERKLSQDRLAIDAHIDQSGLSKFERGKERRMGRAPLTRIAGVLGVSYEKLVAGTDHETGVD
jgi:transcriptional regulator with XRE-family HTH domain